MYALVELIVNLLQLPRAYKWFKTNFGDFDWRPTLIVLGVISILVVALIVIFALAAQS
jgi:hypothetical protein